MRLKIAKILPLAFADTSRQIQCAERNEPERLTELYLRFGCILKQIREKTGLTIQGLSVLFPTPALVTDCSALASLKGLGLRDRVFGPQSEDDRDEPDSANRDGVS